MENKKIIISTFLLFIILFSGIGVTVWLTERQNGLETRSSAESKISPPEKYKLDFLKTTDKNAYKLAAIDNNGFIGGLVGQDPVGAEPYIWDKKLFPTIINGIDEGTHIEVIEVVSDLYSMPMVSAVGYYQSKSGYIGYYWDGIKINEIENLLGKNNEISITSSGFVEYVNMSNLPEEYSSFIKRPELSEVETLAKGINNYKEIVGESNGSAFLWKNNRMIDLSVFLDELGAVSSSANDINNFSSIVGSYITNNPEIRRGFMLIPVGYNDINDNDFNFQAIDLGDFKGSEYIDTFAINDNEEVIGVGWDQQTNESRQFFWADSKYVDIEAFLNRPQNDFLLATGLNDNGFITASLHIASQGKLYPLLMQVFDGDVIGVNYLDQYFDTDEFLPWFAADINDPGEIIGWGMDLGNGELNGWRLTPME